MTNSNDDHKKIDMVKSNGHSDVTVPGPDDNPFTRYAEAAGGSQITGSLLRFVKGDYLAGQDADEVPAGTELVAVMDTLRIGYIRWEDNPPVEHRMGFLSEGYVPPTRRDLSDTDKGLWPTDDEGTPQDPWQYSAYLTLVEPEDPARVFTFATSSKGGHGAIVALCKEYGRIVRQRPDSYPIVRLDVGSYPHSDRSIGRVKTPVLKITRWIPKGGFDNALTGSPEPDGTLPPSTVAAERALF
jgi:hypothetical protein